MYVCKGARLGDPEFSRGPWVLRYFAISRFASLGGICVLSGCVTSHRYAWKRSPVDLPWSSQHIPWHRPWGMGHALVALRWTWLVFVALRTFQRWLNLCSMLWTSWIWEVSVCAHVAFWLAAVTRTWSVTYRFAPSVGSPVFHRTLLLLGVWLQLWAWSLSSSPKNICRLA